jgi:hypothetical protein
VHDEHYMPKINDRGSSRGPAGDRRRGASGLKPRPSSSSSEDHYGLDWDSRVYAMTWRGGPRVGSGALTNGRPGGASFVDGVQRTTSTDLDSSACGGVMTAAVLGRLK